MSTAEHDTNKAHFVDLNHEVVQHLFISHVLDWSSKPAEMCPHLTDLRMIFVMSSCNHFWDRELMPVKDTWFGNRLPSPVHTLPHDICTDLWCKPYLHRGKMVYHAREGSNAVPFLWSYGAMQRGVLFDVLPTAQDVGESEGSSYDLEVLWQILPNPFIARLYSRHCGLPLFQRYEAPCRCLFGPVNCGWMLEHGTASEKCERRWKDMQDVWFHETAKVVESGGGYRSVDELWDELHGTFSVGKVHRDGQDVVEVRFCLRKLVEWNESESWPAVED